jgi:16S rRNA (cytosine1402-N4)-methyltransferase
MITEQEILPQAPFIHTTVLLQEAVDALNIQPGSIIVDATFGGGGHTRAILEQYPDVTVVALDWDTDAIKANSPTLVEQFGERFIMAWGNFANIYRILKKHKINQVNGILADLGTSQNQIKNKDGFSFSIDTPLDMRMSNAHSYVPASTFLMHAPEQELATIFWKYGEEKYSRQIARAIVAHRTKRPFKTTLDFADVVSSAVPYLPYKNGKKQNHPATRAFQALRIAVNHELEHIETFLKAIPEVLAPNGRVAIISFHSLEDRLVKNFILEHGSSFTPINKKPIVASQEELNANPSSRSAKLRVAQKKPLPF